MRANREQPDGSEGWTYNLAPMLAYFAGRFYLHYLSNPIYEHVAPGRTMLTTSADGRSWDEPRVVFPVYELPEEGNDLLRATAEPVPRFAIMHQRMGFHVARNGRLLVLGFYGFSPKPDLPPFDRRGIGRVVREIRADGSWSPIYFIRHNRQAGWNETNTKFPFYKSSDDPGFVDACDSLLADNLVVQQWKEEHGEADPLIRLKGSYKALSYYTLADGRVVGLWKWSLAGITSDRGLSWDWLGEVPTIETAGGKVWGQRTSDGRFALTYNPSTNNEHRWPLAVVTSDDGLYFSDMLVIAGEVAPRRYIGGPFRDYGQNYVRGIGEGNGVPPDGAMWVAFSMNKEDIWICRVPVPIRGFVREDVDEDFNNRTSGSCIDGWNIYSPLWAPVEIAAYPTAVERSLMLTDRDPYDHACAERVFPKAADVVVEVRVMAARVAGKPLFLELWDQFGQIPVRIVLDTDGAIKVCHGRRVENVGAYVTGQWHDLVVRVNVGRHRFEVTLDGNLLGTAQRYQGESAAGAGWYFLAPVDTVERLVLRTGPPRREPNVDTDVQHGSDLPGAGWPLEPTIYYVKRVRIATAPGPSPASPSHCPNPV